MSSEHGFPSRMEDGVDDFPSLARTIGTNIQKISQNTSKIQRMVNQLGTTQDTAEHIECLRQLQQQTNQLAKETNQRLKELSSLPAAQSEQRQRKLQRDRLASEFSTALNNFQAMQRKAAEKEKESVARARANSRLLQPGGIFDEGSKDTQLVDFGPESDRQIQSQDETVGVTAQDLEELKEREGAIMQLEADIVDVNQIFKDLGTMIHEQGDIIDSIEANVETAETSVQQANRELRAASRHQSASRKKICLLLLVLAVAALVLGIVIWLSTRK